MFEVVQLGHRLSKDEFEQQENDIRAALLEAQYSLQQNGIPALIILAGVDGSGKGKVVDRLNKWLDARGVLTHAFWDATDEENERPLFWRYWRRLPSRGEIAMMFGGWYWNALHYVTAKQDATDDLDRRCRLIEETEHMLVQNGMLVIKLWLHISHDTLKQRVKKRNKFAQIVEKLKTVSVSTKDYKSFLHTAERIIRMTDTGMSPWNLIEADDERYRDIAIAKTLLAAMQKRLHDQRDHDRRHAEHELVTDTRHNGATILGTIDLNLELKKSHYQKQLKHYQNKLERLTWHAYVQKRSSVIVFEGWDAAGKGGVIRRITAPMDARLFRVISVAAPTDEELAHHYLWRFWRHVPRAGYMTIYDRSWYGRVLVERVEGLARPDQWSSAYQEINDFEEQLIDHGIMLLKFWLHISPDEQMKRFEQRQQVAWKQYKLTEDDWRNRDQWHAYEQAVNDMVEHTSTTMAPWHLIAANDKRHARIQVLSMLCERLEQSLDDVS